MSTSQRAVTPCGWGVKADMVRMCVCLWQVKLCDSLVTHGPYLSALEMHRDKALIKSMLLHLFESDGITGTQWNAVPVLFLYNANVDSP